MGGQKSPGVPPSGHQPANHSCGTGSWWPVAAQRRPMAGSGAARGSRRVTRGRGEGGRWSPVLEVPSQCGHSVPRPSVSFLAPSAVTSS